MWFQLFQGQLSTDSKAPKRCLPPPYILQLEEKTQRLDGKDFFVLIAGPCYFTRLAIRNTRKT